METWTVSRRGWCHLCWQSHGRREQEGRGTSAVPAGFAEGRLGWAETMAAQRAVMPREGEVLLPQLTASSDCQPHCFHAFILLLEIHLNLCLHFSHVCVKDVLTSTFTQGRILLVFTAAEQPARALLWADLFPTAAKGKPAVEARASLARRMDCCHS